MKMREGLMQMVFEEYMIGEYIHCTCIVAGAATTYHDHVYIREIAHCRVI